MKINLLVCVCVPDSEKKSDRNREKKKAEGRLHTTAQVFSSHDNSDLSVAVLLVPPLPPY